MQSKDEEASTASELPMLGLCDAVQRKLNAIDELYSIIHNNATGGIDAEFNEKMMNCIPQFVASGAQSSGKSSVLRRISTIRLPEASGCCTRIATVLKLRRQPHVPIALTLCHHDKNTQQSIAIVNGDVTSAVSQAQAIGLANVEAASSGFSRAHSIVISVSEPTIPNVTLVDLPGFTNSSDDAALVVEQTVKEYTARSGTLVLHVIRADQDFDTILGNDTLRKMKDKNCIVVLTHCDQLAKEDPQKARSRLDDTISKTTGPRFAILGSFSGSLDDEQTVLQSMECLEPFRDSIELGVKALNVCIEQTVIEHLNTTIPLAEKTLRSYLKTTNDQLSMVQPLTPYEVFATCQKRLEDQLKRALPQLENDIRCMCEDLRLNIMSFQLDKAVKHRKFDPLFDEYEVGETVYVDDGPSHVCKACIKSIKSKTACDVQITKTKDMRLNVQVADLYSTASLHETIIEAIVTKCHNRGLRNVALVDRQKIVEEYAVQFGDHYHDEMLSAVRKFQTLFSALIDELFSECPVPKSGLLLMKALKEKLTTHLGACNEAAVEAAARLRRYTRPPLVHTTNDHYLNQIYVDMLATVKEGTSFATETGAATMIYYQILAFLKVEKKVICEAACKELQIAFYLQTTIFFENMLFTTVEEMLPLVKELPKVAEKRKRLTARKAKLEEALGALRGIDAI